MSERAEWNLRDLEREKEAREISAKKFGFDRKEFVKIKR